MSDPITTAADGLKGYVRHGPSFWSCARYFTLCSLRYTGEVDGGSADVCRACVSQVAREALLTMLGDRDAMTAFKTLPPVVGQPFSAIVTCGMAVAYDLTGITDGHAAVYDGEHTACAACGEEIE